eukprot:765653-Hanusia_phi.AAC.4
MSNNKAERRFVRSASSRIKAPVSSSTALKAEDITKGKDEPLSSGRSISHEDREGRQIQAEQMDKVLRWSLQRSKKAEIFQVWSLHLQFSSQRREDLNEIRSKVRDISRAMPAALSDR